MRMRHYEAKVFIPTPKEGIFEYLDDPVRLASHMSESSWKMGGGRMTIELDAAKGKCVGSHVRLSGRVLGLNLRVDEIITERRPPALKVWETTGSPRLLVIGHYRLGFEITPERNGSILRVFIDYALPEHAPARWLGFVLSKAYAKWCTQQMADDAVRHFAALSSRPSSRAA